MSDNAISSFAYKQDRQNCFLDLQRAATAFYLHPKGKSWRIFLDHALKVLQGERNLERFAYRLKRIRQSSSKVKKNEVIRRADEMLTLGILMKKLDK